ncbi:hypothetical protein E4U42_001319 [Claviceps africana]|uniref:Uncharacterized protein n=1 Tax=Claviceps africana TaxID=83212 RepID=A0A8K0IZE3_9HYPO|nr:hypothetical protein E4U42_001319 [Claviceps africana]
MRFTLLLAALTGLALADFDFENDNGPAPLEELTKVSSDPPSRVLAARDPCCSARLNQKGVIISCDCRYGEPCCK